MCIRDSLKDGFGVPAVSFPGLRMVPGAAGRAISKPRTTLYNLARAPRFARAVAGITRAIARERPDVVVNFWDLLGGIACARATGAGGARAPRVVAISSNHYLLDHPAVPFPRPDRVEELLFRALNRLSAPAGATRVALSLRPLDPPAPPVRPLHILPPLLRRVVMDAEPAPGGHLLVYLLHPGYAEELARWHERRPEIEVHAFSNRPGAPESEALRPGLTLHRLSETRFLALMRGCRALATTAGFQAVAEARWLGKPVLVVPTAEHVEQLLNAQEIVAAGAGMAADRFDLDALLRWVPGPGWDHEGFRAWVREGRTRMLELMEGAPARAGAAPGLTR